MPSLLVEKIRARQATRISEGLEQDLDLTPLDRGEVLIFCKKISSLLALIMFNNSTVDQIFTYQKSYALEGCCHRCYEIFRQCACPK